MATTDVQKWIRHKLSALAPELKILDVGAGQCQFKGSCTHLEYEAQDFCKYNGLEEGKWDYDDIDIKSDICDIPKPDNWYNAILCSDVLEHIYDPIKAVNEMYRLLKVGGVLLISTPFACMANQQPYFYSSGLHLNWYKKTFKNKFTIKELHYDGNWFTQVIQELERFKTSPIQKYVNVEIQLDIYAIDKAITTLNDANIGSKNSEEILCGSYQIEAIKL